MLACQLYENHVSRRAQVKVERFDVFLTPEAEAALPAGASGELALWRAGAHPHPLTHYGIRSVGPIKLGKGLIDPERVASYEARAGPAQPLDSAPRALRGRVGWRPTWCCMRQPAAQRTVGVSAKRLQRAASCCEAGTRPAGRATLCTPWRVLPDG